MPEIIMLAPYKIFIRFNGLCPQPASLHHCVKASIHRVPQSGCPCELLYADYLMISAESMEELLVKLKTWKSEMEKKGLWMNMKKNKIMVSGMSQSGPAEELVVSIKQEMIAMQSSMVAACAGYTRNAVALRVPCA